MAFPGRGRPRSFALALVLLSTAVEACTHDAPSAPLRIAAAASLAEVLPPLLAEYRDRNGRRVEVSFGSSGALAAQFRHGAPFDALFLAAGSGSRGLREQGLAVAARPPWIRNRILLVGAPGTGEVGGSGGGGGDDRVASLAARWRELAGKRVGIGAEGVPAGEEARRWLAAALPAGAQGPELIPLAHARAVLAAVQSGSCAAAFVYASDAHGTGLRILARPPADFGGPAYPFLIPPASTGVRAERSRALADFLAARVQAFVAAGFLAREGAG